MGQRLGQHFLKSKEIIRKIIEAGEITKNDIVLEVGPGRGALTEAILQTGAQIIAIEKDARLVEFLKNKFENAKNLTLIHNDILKTHPMPYTLNPKPYKVVANIPYYITSRFLRQFLESDKQPTLMVLMLQKEVAERICARPPSLRSGASGQARPPQMSLLSLSVQVYGEPKIIADVPRNLFFPPPKVDSAILKIENISKKFFTENQMDEKKFFEIAKKGFGHKRKFLKNNLQISENILKNCGLKETSRAQELSPEDWLKIYSSPPITRLLT